jgi:Rps23 Pro-64 3,4-dihydroxylase Tpa1-like proline 4-hydroxylase
MFAYVGINRLAGRGDENIASGDALTTLMTRMCEVRDELTRVTGTKSDPTCTQIQLACYEGGGKRLKRHRDSYPGGPPRRLTAILYLNVGWNTEHG